MLTLPADLVLATGNLGKAREFGRLLGDAFTVRPLPLAVALPEETGRTFAANARLKAEGVFAALHGEVAVLADDSGLEVGALSGRPGVMSARYAGEGACDEDNVRKLLVEMAGVEDRSARFVCTLCLVVPGDVTAESGQTQGGWRVVEVEGVSTGTITLSPRGTDGFGYDPIFQPLGWVLTLAEVDPAEKDRVSHRGAAARALLGRLTQEGLVRHGS